MRTTAIASSLLLLFLSAPAAAKEYVVQMKNNGAKGAMVFEPAFLRIAPGDTVRFVPSDKTHNAETIPGMLPAGAVPFVGKDAPSDASEFAHPDVLIALTIMLPFTVWLEDAILHINGTYTIPLISYRQLRTIEKGR